MILINPVEISNVFNNSLTTIAAKTKVNTKYSHPISKKQVLSVKYIPHPLFLTDNIKLD